MIKYAFLNAKTKAQISYIDSTISVLLKSEVARLKNLSATCYSTLRNESHQVVSLDMQMSL